MSINTPHPHESTDPASGRDSGSGSPNRFLTKLLAIATLGGLLFGYDTGVISGALLYLREDLQLTSLQEGVVVSSLLFGAMLGALLGGKMADALGRKGSLQICGVLFLVGALGSGLAPGVELMVVSRIILGLGVGAASVTVPVYLAEMAPTHRRGRIVAVNEVMIVSGQLLAYIVNVIIDQTLGGQGVWRIMLAIAAVPAVFLLIGMFFLPDSPRWYAVRGRLDDARRVLYLSRDPAEAAEDYAIIAEHARRDVAEDKGAALRDLRAYAWMRRLVWIGCGLAAAQQVTGVNTILYYGTSTLEKTGFGASAALVGTIGLGVAAVLGMIIGLILVGFMGRRKMLLIGFAAIAACHVALALSFLLPESTAQGFVILGVMMLFQLVMQIFVGLVVWIVLSELFPMVIRGFAMGIAVFALWTANTIISFVFPIVDEALGSTGTFGIFAVINLGLVLFVFKFVPETRGRALEELEDDFRAHDAAHFVHEAPVGVHGS